MTPTSIKIINHEILNELLKKASDSERKRMMMVLSKAEDTAQHMVNACIKGTYIQPHKHEDPDKTETLHIIKGKIAVLIFTDSGDISDCIILDENGENKIIQIPSKIFHTIVVFSENSVMHEIIDGPYNQKTHKKTPAWAPNENDIGREKYLEALKGRIERYL